MLLLSVLLGAGLSSLGLASEVAVARRSATTLRVFAAASLAEAFTEISKLYERAHAGTVVRLNLAGSHQLAAQIEQGAPADVFASADDRWMDHLVEEARVAGEPSTFAGNRLIVIVPRTNPARIGRLSDLARRGVKLVIGAEAVPVGRYSRQALANLSSVVGFDPDFKRRALANVVSEEENVKSVVGKVQIGEADAGIVYRSDVTPSLSRYVRVFELPDSANVIARYPIAVVEGSRSPEGARAFIALVLSAEGQRILARHAFLPAMDARP